MIFGNLFCMNELDLLNTNEPAKAEQNWISKQELAEICKCDIRTITNVEINKVKNSEAKNKKH